MILYYCLILSLFVTYHLLFQYEKRHVVRIKFCFCKMLYCKPNSNMNALIFYDDKHLNHWSWMIQWAEVSSYEQKLHYLCICISIFTIYFYALNRNVVLEHFNHIDFTHKYFTNTIWCGHASKFCYFYYKKYEKQPTEVVILLFQNETKNNFYQSRHSIV